jgi:hypothetical protein
MPIHSPHIILMLSIKCHPSSQLRSRTQAFVSGGLIPTNLRGTSSNVVGHIADWYATICALAGVDSKDDSPIKPLPVDPSRPKQDIYSNGAFPGVDGVDLWPFLVAEPQPNNASAAHPEGLWLSAEVMMRGDYKLVVSQQDPAKTNSGPTLGWKCGGSKHDRCNTTVSASCGGEELFVLISLHLVRTHSSSHDA